MKTILKQKDDNSIIKEFLKIVNGFKKGREYFNASQKFC